MNALSAVVVICAYTLDRWQELRESVRSAADQSPAPASILLVVDGNLALLAKAEAEIVPEHPTLRVMANSRKQGLSGARNTALQEVTEDIVVFLDDDAAAEPGWLAALMQPYEDASVIAVGGRAKPVWPADRARPVTLPTPGSEAPGELDWVVGCTYTGQPDSALPVRNLMGCNMSFRRAIFEEVGGFSENLGRVGNTPLGCEETELCIRASRSNPGTQIIFEPRAAVRHHVSLNRLTWRYLRRRCYAEGLSKAAVSAMTGSRQALSTERGYTLQILPRGILREMLRGITSASGRSTSFGGSAAIALGLAATACGYLRGRLGRVSAVDASVPRLRLSAPPAV